MVDPPSEKNVAKEFDILSISQFDPSEKDQFIQRLSMLAKMRTSGTRYLLVLLSRKIRTAGHRR
jgi:hypothetical protein